MGRPPCVLPLPYLRGEVGVRGSIRHERRRQATAPQRPNLSRLTDRGGEFPARGNFKLTDGIFPYSKFRRGLCHLSLFLLLPWEDAKVGLVCWMRTHDACDGGDCPVLPTG